MRSPHFFYSLILALVTLFSLSACVITGADFESDASRPMLEATKNSGTVAILETAPHQPYRILGVVEGYARAFNLWSSDPTREDVNEALRVRAAEQGADAVINVTYVTERTGLASRGMMTGTGTAIVYLASQPKE